MQDEMEISAKSEVAKVKVQDEKDSVVKSESAEVSMQGEMASKAKEDQPESRVSMIQNSGEANVWKVQVENLEVFIEELEAYLREAQMDYEKTEEGMTIYQVQESEALRKWLHEHSHSFEGSEITAESDVQLEIK